MATETTSPQKARAPVPAIPFRDMSLKQKLAFIGKVSVFLISGGFAYPNIFTD